MKSKKFIFILVGNRIQFLQLVMFYLLLQQIIYNIIVIIRNNINIYNFVWLVSRKIIMIICKDLNNEKIRKKVQKGICIFILVVIVQFDKLFYCVILRQVLYSEYNVVLVLLIFRGVKYYLQQYLISSQFYGKFCFFLIFNKKYKKNIYV